MRNIVELLDTLEDLFEEHCGDDNDTMSKDEFKVLVDEGIKDTAFEGKLEISDADEAFAKLDENADGELTFGEFIKCIGLVCSARRKRKGRRPRGSKGGRRRKGGRGRKDEGSDEDEGDDE